MTAQRTIPPRLADWRTRLDAYLASVAAEPFQYGRLDCALFAAGAVEAMTGGDPVAGIGPYTTLKGGLKALSKAGFRSPEHVVGLHFDPVPTALAQVGDIAAVEQTEGMPALGIVAGEVIAVLRPEGLGWLPRMQATDAWAVP